MRSSPTDSPQPAHSELAEQVTHMLSAYGPLARDNPSYRQRDGQLDMACAVADAIARSEALVVEAGTGVGKTFAYLIPALLSGERVLVSTATKNLQDQLFTRDLPYLTGLLGLPLRKALLKGRSSYLCLYRLELARQDPVVHLRELQAGMHRIEQFARSTCSGDMSELEGVDERSPLLPLVTSTRDNCLGQQCPHSKNCHVNLARREAMAADVVVVNHHLFFADMAVRESGVAELLPTVHTVIFDEAHQLNDIGTQFLGQQLSSSHVLDFNRDMLATGMQLARGLAPWQELSRDLEQAVREWRLAGGRHATGTRLRWTGEIPEGLDPDVWLAAMRGLQERLQQTQQALDMMSELGPDFVRLRQRAAELIDKVQLFRHPCADESVRWLDASGALRLVQSPLDIARVVREKLLQGNAQAIPELADARADGSPQDDDDMPWHDDLPEPEWGIVESPLPVVQQRAWIFTSATLGENERLEWFTRPCGLDEVPTLRVDSPFDYARQAAVYVPRSFPPPGGIDHLHAVADLAARSARVLGGRTLVLTTTLRGLRAIGERLREQLAHDSGLVVLLQGEASKARLIARFREGSTGAQGQGCVLVASASFWEGVDVPGDALELVVIDKLPFPPPQDPLVEARTRRLEREGGNAFREYFLPETAVMLKQGAGRLIRSETDQGVLIIGDARLLQKNYGNRLLRVLGDVRRLPDEAALDTALQQLAKTHQA